MKKISFFQFPSITIKNTRESSNTSYKTPYRKSGNLRTINFMSWCKRTNQENEKLNFKVVFKTE